MPKMTPETTRRTRRALLAFYDGRRRALPWRASGRRRHPDPYAVWVSEVMLQQTRVEAVLPYYRRWMQRFPDVDALAEAPLDDVLKAWEGLGYYSRARNLHDAARFLRDRMHGELPRTAADLRALPGVGAYTAGAVASIAFGERVPAVDGNVRRVLARLLDEADPSAAWLRERAGELVDPDRPGDFNQALMELGATVCTPRAPGCGACPLGRECRALARGTVSRRPRPRTRPAIPRVEFGVAVLLRSHPDGTRELLLARRPARGLLGGLWEMPSLEVSGGSSAHAAARGAACRAGLRPGRSVAELPAVRHVYSHFEGLYRPFVWRFGAERGGAASDAELMWVDRAGLEARALAGAQRKIAAGVAALHL